MKDEKKKRLTTNAGVPVVDNQNVMTAGPRGPQMLQDVWFLEKLAHFDREVIPERRMHAKGSGAFGTFTVTQDISRYTRAKIFSQVGKRTELFARFTTVAGERGSCRCRARHSWLCREVLHGGRQLGRGRQQHAGVFHAGSVEVSRPEPCGETRPAHEPAQREKQLRLLDLLARSAASGHDRHE